ncbi:MAG: AbiEi antitoxin N-terminal domain-containing protein [Desulfobacterales bacterium]|jgi:predicted transcriptional regulator of viral defense system
MSRKNEILDLAKRKGMIRAKDLEAIGISRNYLYGLCHEGILKKNARGIYTLPNAPVTEHSSLAEIAKRFPHAVVCLLSALAFYEITTQVPHEVWLAVPRGSWKPNIDYPRLSLTYVTGDAYSFGIQEHNINGVMIKIYSPAKTVADCFKFRNKVGLDVAIEALREVWRSRKASVDELLEAARIDRVSKVMRPYLEATV